MCKCLQDHFWLSRSRNVSDEAVPTLGLRGCTGRLEAGRGGGKGGQFKRARYLIKGQRVAAWLRTMEMGDRNWQE